LADERLTQAAQQLPASSNLAGVAIGLALDLDQAP